MNKLKHEHIFEDGCCGVCGFPEEKMKNETKKDGIEIPKAQ